MINSDVEVAQLLPVLRAVVLSARLAPVFEHLHNVTVGARRKAAAAELSEAAGIEMRHFGGLLPRYFNAKDGGARHSKMTTGSLSDSSYEYFLKLVLTRSAVDQVACSAAQHALTRRTEPNLLALRMYLDAAEVCSHCVVGFHLERR